MNLSESLRAAHASAPDVAGDLRVVSAILDAARILAAVERLPRLQVPDDVLATGEGFVAGESVGDATAGVLLWHAQQLLDRVLEGPDGAKPIRGTGHV